jgi:hypothetical protein
MTVLERSDKRPPAPIVLGTPIVAVLLALLFRKSQEAIPCAPSGFRPNKPRTPVATRSQPPSPEVSEVSP